MSRLFGRTAECEALDNAVASARKGHGGSIIVTGGPGAGKSALLDYVMSTARDAETIRIEGLESEAEIGLAGLHRLLLCHAEGRSVLPPAQRRALDASLGLGGRTEAAPFLLGLAVLTLLNDLSRSRLLVCLIDDAHWLDPESAQVLTFVARRLRGERILMLFAARDQLAGSAFNGIPELAVRALGLDDAVELLLGAAGPILVDRQVARDIAVRAEGNPLALLEVGRELKARRTPPSVLLDEPLPVGSRLHRHYETQICNFPEETRQLLLLAAANMGSAPHILWRATELAGIDPDAAEPAERGHLIDLSPDLRFRHPVIRAAAYGSASGQARRHAHAVLAAAARALDDRQAAAWHLAAATVAPAEDVASELEAAADAAHGRGSLLNESAFLARAAELSPPGPRAVHRRLRAAETALLGGAPLRAESLAGLIQLSASVSERAQAEHLRVQARIAASWSVAEAPVLLLDAGLLCLDETPGLAREILLEAVTATITASQMTARITPAELGTRILQALSGHAPRSSEEQLLSGLATLLTGRYGAAAPLLRQAIGTMAAQPEPAEQVPFWLMATSFAATAIWEDRAALRWLAGCEDLARRTGAMRPLTLCLIGESIANGARGQLALAEQQLIEGRELGQALGWNAGQLGSFSGVRNIAFSGDRKALRRVVANQRTTAAARGSGDMIRVVLAAQTILHLGYGEYADAYETATAMRRDDTVGMSVEALPAIVEAGLRSDHAAEAGAALAELRQCATASGTSWACGLLARSTALMAAPDQACELYQEAIDTLSGTTATADLARAHLLFGEWLRRHQRPGDARSQLQTALGLFTSMGAVPFARRTRGELQAAGASAVPLQTLNSPLTAYDGPSSSSPPIASWAYDNSNNAVSGMTDPIGHLTTETSYAAGNAYVMQQKGFNAFGESLGQTATLPSAEGALAGTYTLTHLYSSVTGLPLRDTYPASPLGTGQTTAALPAETVTHGYATGFDLPAGMSGSLAAYVQNVTYSAFFQVAQQIIGNSTNYAYVTDSYDPHTGALTNSQTENTAVSTTPYDNTSYTYDPGGNITSQTDVRTGTQTETQCYSYNTLARLTQAWTTNGSPACSSGPSTGTGGTVGDGIAGGTYWTSWAYDPLGNQTTQTQHSLTGGTNTVTTYTYNGNSAGQPDTLTGSSATGPSGTTAAAYTYDPDGNTLTRTLPSGKQTLTWTDDGKLATDASSGTASYIYDADSNLLLQKDPGQVTIHLFGDTQQIKLNTSTGTITGTRILPLPGGGQVVRTGSGTSYTFELTDQHSTGLLTLNSTAQSPAWRQYTPYGAPRGTAPPSWPDTNAFLGKPADTTTGLDIIGVRAYDPATGRFLSIDPIVDTSNPQTMAGYAYAADNPATKSDPTGLHADCSPGTVCDATQYKLANGEGFNYSDAIAYNNNQGGYSDLAGGFINAAYHAIKPVVAILMPGSSNLLPDRIPLGNPSTTSYGAGGIYAFLASLSVGGEGDAADIGLGVLDRLAPDTRAAAADVARSDARFVTDTSGRTADVNPSDPLSAAASHELARMQARASIGTPIAPNASPLDLAGTDDVDSNAVMRDPQNTIDQGNQMFNYGVKPWLPHGTPAAVTNGTWGDPFLAAAVIAALISKLLS